MAAATSVSSSESVGLAVHAGEPYRDRLERPGRLERVAHDHEAAHCDQRLVTEAQEEFGRAQCDAGPLIRKELEREHQHGKDDQARGFQRDALARKEHERDDHEGHHCERVYIG